MMNRLFFFKIFKNFSLMFLVFFSFSSLSFASNFNLSVTVGTSTKTLGFAKAEDVIDAMKVAKITELFPTYSGTEAVNLSLDFRGLPMSLSYQGGGTTLVLDIPALGLNQSFTGSSRDDSNTLFKNWMKKDGANTLNAVMKKLVEVSPNDPLAGNPQSLMGQMVKNDFGRSAENTQNQMESGASSSNVMGIGANFQSTSDNGKKGSSFTIPFSYGVRFDFDPRHELSFYLPISYMKVEDAASYNIGLGVGYRYPLTNNWSLTPNIGTGVVGSIDLGAGGQIVSGSVTSTYVIHLPHRMSLSVANMIGNYQSVKIKVSDYESDPNLNNTVFRNGFMWSIPHKFFKWQAESELFAIDTRFTGSKLYMDSFDEFGYSLGSDKTTQDLTKHLRIGLSYLYSSKAKGYSANFGYSF